MFEKPERRRDVILVGVTVASIGAYLVAATEQTADDSRRPMVAAAIEVMPSPLPLPRIVRHAASRSRQYVVPKGYGRYQAPSQSDLARLRNCESSDNPATNTGNGFYGAYQFDLETYHGLGYVGLPSNASLATQTDAAIKLEEDRGWQPWPACSQKLGLVAIRNLTP